MTIQVIVGGLFVLVVIVYAVAVGAAFVLRHPRISGAYGAVMAALGVGAVIEPALGVPFILGLGLAITAATVGGIWKAF